MKVFPFFIWKCHFFYLTLQYQKIIKTNRNMKKEIKSLADRIESNITIENGAYLNTREIDIPKGSLIVLGFIERIGVHKDITNAYVMMGVYEDGFINSTVYFKDGMVLYATNKTDNVGDKISADDNFMETQTWWRIPTDDELTLYEIIYNKNTLLDKVDYILDNFDDMDKGEIEEYLMSLKYRIESMEM